ncbi:DUF2332 family protein [Streptomyces sp. NPDC055721]|uniref:DUF2332 family protein n=1 Tax=Streptomyces sp. NPDC127132 TaxID=3345374 RepID=UPI003636572C
MNDDTGHPASRHDTHAIAERFRAFAAHQAAGSSPTLERWSEAIAEDSDLLALLTLLPPGKQQPNLVFAAARWHGARPGDADSLHELLTTRWTTVQATIRARATQTNEAARCAAILLGLQRVPGPVALVEIGAAAGLCLIPDQYSYTFSGAARLDPASGPSPVSIDIHLGDGLEPPVAMPDISWRAGLDLNPLNPADPDTLAWLQTLIWPEHEARRARLTAAAALTAEYQVRVSSGDLRTGLESLVADTPSNATLVITHSATLAYLDEPARKEVVEHIAGLGARRLSFEGRGVDPAVPHIGTPITPDTLFVAALDGTPYALGDGHGATLTHP